MALTTTSANPRRTPEATIRTAAVAGNRRRLADDAVISRSALVTAFALRGRKGTPIRGRRDVAGGVVQAIRAVVNPDKLGYIGPVSDVARLPEKELLQHRHDTDERQGNR
jgi:hypothetical protein